MATINTTGQELTHSSQLIAQNTATWITASPSGSSSTSDPAVSTTLDQTGTTSPVQITLSQAGLDFLAAPSSLTSAYQASAQEALNRLDQLAKSSHAVAREQTEQQVSLIKAQMCQLMQMKALMSPKALAQELAQLARQLAAAVLHYTQSGGTDTADAAVGNAILAAPQNSSQLSTQAGTETTTGATQTTTPPGTSGTSGTSDSQAFAQTVQGVSSQLKALLQDSKNRLKQHNITSDSDIESAQGALDTVDQLTMKL